MPSREQRAQIARDLDFTTAASTQVDIASEQISRRTFLQHTTNAQAIIAADVAALERQLAYKRYIADHLQYMSTKVDAEIAHEVIYWEMNFGGAATARAQERALCEEGGFKAKERGEDAAFECVGDLVGDAEFCLASGTGVEIEEGERSS